MNDAVGATGAAYACPDCGEFVMDGSIAHQHQDGEWIYTEDIRRWYMNRRWSEKYPESTSAIEREKK